MPVLGGLFRCVCADELLKESQFFSLYLQFFLICKRILKGWDKLFNLFV